MWVKKAYEEVFKDFEPRVSYNLITEAIINYVARLNGDGQFWQLNQTITAGVGKRIKFNISEPLSNYVTVFSSDDGISVWCYIENTNRVIVRFNETSFYGVTFDHTIKGDVTIDFYADRIEYSNQGVASTRPNTVTPDFYIERLGARESSFSRLNGYVKDFQVSDIDGGVTNEILLTNKDQGAYQVATTTPLGANLYTQEVIENPSNADDQWTYLGNGRWQLIGDGSLNALQFLHSSSQPEKGYVQFEIESISGGTLTCTASTGTNSTFDTTGIKTFYHDGLSEIGQIQFKRRIGSVQAIIKDIKHYDADGILVAEMIKYTPDVWEKVLPEPVKDYVYRLDGLAKYHQLSAPIEVAATDDFDITLDILTNSTEFYILGSDTTSTNNRLVVYNNGDSVLGCGLNGNITSIPLNVYSPLRFYRASGVVKLELDGELLASISDSNLAFVVSRVGGKYDGSTAVDNLDGFVSNFSFSRNGVEEVRIPLTNKAQGATQLPTVGNVSATIVGFDENDWEEV